MGCASSKPSTTDNTPTTKTSKKVKDSNDKSKSSKKSSQKSQSASPEKTPKQTADSTHATSTSLDQTSEDLVKLDAHLLEQIKANEDLVIAYIVKRVLKDLNNELIHSNTSNSSTAKSNGSANQSVSSTFASVALAAVSASDNEDLIIDVATKAVNLVEHSSNQANFTYKSLNHSLKSCPFLCKNQTHKARICDLTVDTVRECLTNLTTSQITNLAEFLTSSPDFKFIKDEQSKHKQAQHEPPLNPVLMSRTEANELARMLFLSNRGRPVVHASSSVKDAYYVNKFQDETSTEVTVTQEEIDDVLNKNLTSTILNSPAFSVLETSPTKKSITNNATELNDEEEPAREQCELTWSSLVEGKSEQEKAEEIGEVGKTNDESDNLESTLETVSDCNRNENLNKQEVELVNENNNNNINNKSDENEIIKTDETSNQQQQPENTQLISQEAEINETKNDSVESNSTNLNQDVEISNNTNISNILNEPVPQETNANTDDDTVVVDESKQSTTSEANETNLESATPINNTTEVEVIQEVKSNVDEVVEANSVEQNVQEDEPAAVAELVENLELKEKITEQVQETDNQTRDSNNNDTSEVIELQQLQEEPSKNEEVEILEEAKQEETTSVKEQVKPVVNETKQEDTTTTTPEEEVEVVQATEVVTLQEEEPAKQEEEEEKKTLVIQGSDEIKTETTQPPSKSKTTESEPTQSVVNNSDNLVESASDNAINDESKNGEDSAFDTTTATSTLEETKEKGELDPILKQSLLDDRFYNNDSFKTEPPVNGDLVNDAATKIQAALRAENVRDDLKDEIQANSTHCLNPSEIILTAERLLRLVETVDSNLLLLDSSSNLNQNKNKSDEFVEESLSNNKKKEEIIILYNNNNTNSDEDYLINSQIDQMLNHLAMDSDKKNDEIKEEKLTSADLADLSTHKSQKELDKAAIKIQSTFRGYKTRKHLNNKPTLVKRKSQEKKIKKRSNSESVTTVKQETQSANDTSNHENETTKSNSEIQNNSSTSKKAHISDPQTAAVKIQSTFRGYKTRKLLKSSKNDNGSDSDKTPESSTPDISTDSAVDLNNENTKNNNNNNTVTSTNKNNSSGKNKNRKKNRK